MRPVLFELFGLPVYSYGFAFALAFAVATVAVALVSRRYEVEPIYIIDLGLITCVSAILGARLVFVVLNLPWYLAEPVRMLVLTDGGLSFHGGLTAGIVSGILYCRFRGIDRWLMADLVAPYIALGYSIVRIGCFLRGCCFGVVTDVPWAFAVPAVDDLPRHPTQLYSAVLSFLLFIYLYSRRDHTGFRGMLMFQYVALYSLSRFVVEFAREGQRLALGLTLAQWVSLGVAFVTFALIGLLSYRFHKAGGDIIDAEAS